MTFIVILNELLRCFAIAAFVVVINRIVNLFYPEQIIIMKEEDNEDE